MAAVLREYDRYKLRPALKLNATEAATNPDVD